MVASLATRRRQPLLERAKEVFDRGNYAEAVGSFSRAAEENPRYADVRNFLGLALHLSGHSLEAIQQFREALALNPRYTEAHLNLALVLNDLGRLDEARASFWRAAQAEGAEDGGLGRSARARLANMHAELGALYGRHGRHAEAGDQYRRALELASDYHDIRVKLARSYLELGRDTLAASEFSKVLARKPRDLQARLGLGLVHFRQGERERARALWEECRTLDPEDRTVKVYLGML